MLFQKRNVFEQLGRNPILVDRSLLLDFLQKTPVFIRDEMVFEILGAKLISGSDSALAFSDCLVADNPPPSNRIDRIINQVVALDSLST
jgi:hypothetical protein